MEWLLFGISASGVGLLCLQLKSLSRWVGLALLLLLGGSVAAAKFWQDRTTAVATKAQQFQRTLPREGRPGGYVSSNTCQSCHPREHASWQMSYHRTMTQYATPDSVRGPFNHPPLEQLDSPISLSQRGDEFWVEMDDPDWVARRGPIPGATLPFSNRPASSGASGCSRVPITCRFIGCPVRRAIYNICFPMPTSSRRSAGSPSMTRFCEIRIFRATRSYGTLTA